MRKFFFAAIMTVVLLALPVVQTAVAASGSSKVYYNSKLSAGTTSNINSTLSNMGYSSSRKGDPSSKTVLDSFGNSKVVHILSHGVAGKIVLKSGILSANEIKNKYSSLSTKFVFLEGCQMANSSSTYGDLDDVLHSLGVSCTLAFEGDVAASTDSDGVHLFANLLYMDMNSNRWSVSNAAATAMATLYDQSGQYYGVDTMVIKGSASIY